MKCREVNKLFVAYLDNEVIPSERTMIEAHLVGCTSCERKLSALSSTRSRLTESLKIQAAHASPAPLALSRLQARLAEEMLTPNHRLSAQQGGFRMKLRWKIACGITGSVIIAAATVALVPSARATAGDFLGHIFIVSSDGSGATVGAFRLDYVPESVRGGDSALMFGSVSGAPDAGGADTAQQSEVVFQNGDAFLAVKTGVPATGESLPDGPATTVKGHPAVLNTGLSGTYEMESPPAPPAGTPAEGGTHLETGTGADAASGLESGTHVGATSAAATVASGVDQKPITRSIVYTGANKLTWDSDGTRIELLSNLSVEEMMKIAEGMSPTE